MIHLTALHAASYSSAHALTGAGFPGRDAHGVAHVLSGAGAHVVRHMGDHHAARGHGLDGGHAVEAAVVAAAGVLALAAGGLVVGALFRRIDAASQPTAGGPAPSIVAAGRILRGGAWIGVLERLTVYSSLIAGWPEGIAIALALKGLARYPELQAKTSAAAERFIIGTFISVLWACACAGLAHWVLGRLH